MSAVTQRYSVRAFLDKPVSKALLEKVLLQAQQSPSGGNLQPWHVYVTAGEDREAFLQKVQLSVKAHPAGEPGSPDIYPPKLKEPYKARRAQCGYDMYSALGIPKEDKMAGIMQVMKNFEFFGAPVGIFFAIDKTMGRPQWSHMGMYIQSLMVAAVEAGLGTCPQEAWMLRHKTVRDHFDIPDELEFYCGLALGWADPDHAINNYRTQRASLDEVVTFRGL